MMRENEILAAAMDIERGPRIFAAHNRAFNVPARAPLAPRRLPERLALFLRLPENEIERVLLLILTGDKKGSRAAPEIVEILVRKLAVLAELTCAVIDRAVLCDIGISFVDQNLDHVDHALNLLRRLRVNRRRTDVQRTHILLALRDIPLGND